MNLCIRMPMEISIIPATTATRTFPQKLSCHTLLTTAKAPSGFILYSSSCSRCLASPIILLRAFCNGAPERSEGRMGSWITALSMPNSLINLLWLSLFGLMNGATLSPQSTQMLWYLYQLDESNAMDCFSISAIKRCSSLFCFLLFIFYLITPRLRGWQRSVADLPILLQPNVRLFSFVFLKEFLELIADSGRRPIQLPFAPSLRLIIHFFQREKHLSQLFSDIH
jgi:hypothetical protein